MRAELMRGIWKVVLAVFLFVRAGDVRPQPIEADPSEYLFYPGSPLSLGLGLSPNDVTQVKLPCLVFTPRQLETGAVRTSTSIQLVTNAAQLRQAGGIDAKIDASYLSAKAGAGGGSEYSSLFEANSIVLVMRAESEYGRLHVDSPALTDHAKRLIDDGSKFALACGSRVVVQERRGASVSAILAMSNVSREVQNKVRAELSGGGGWGPLSASASATVKSEAKRAASSGRLDVKTFATGGPGLSGASELIRSMSTSEDAFNVVQVALADYLKQFTFQNSAPLAYKVVSWETFGWRPESVDLWTRRHEERLRAIVDAYRKAELWRDSAQAILKRQDARAENPLDFSIDIDALERAVRDVETYLDTTAELHSKCKTAKNVQDCAVAVTLSPAVLALLPAVPARPFARWFIETDKGDLSADEVSLVLDGTADLLLRSIAFKPAAEKARIGLDIIGDYVVGAQVFVEVGSETKFINSAGLLRTRRLAVERDGYELEAGPSSLIEGAVSEANVSYWLKSGRHNPNAVIHMTFGLRVRDQLGRDTNIRFMEVRSFREADGKWTDEYRYLPL